jgi:hypothetical protein
MQPRRHDRATAVVPAAFVPSSLTCLRSLGSRGVGTISVSERDSPEDFCSRHCDEAIRMPSPRENYREYADALLGLARRPEVRAILPVRESDVYVLSKYRETFAEHVGTPFPTFETLQRVQNRMQLYEIAARAGVSTPETKLLTEVDDWSGRWIVKARYAILSDDYLDSETEEKRVMADGSTTTSGGSRSPTSSDSPTSNRSSSSPAGLVHPPSTEYLPPDEDPDVDALSERWGHVPIAQEYMPGTDEYGFFAIYDRGEPLATFQHRQIRGFEYSGGASAFRKSVRIPELDAAGRAVLDALDWHGPAMVEFKRDPRTGEFQLMEVNPRFWSSLPFSVSAGADFPYYYWLLATDQQERIDHSYEAGLGGHLLTGELFYLRSLVGGDVALVDRPSIPGAVSAVLTSLVEYPRFDYLDVTDPRPFVRHVSDHVGGGISRRLRQYARPQDS